MLVIRISEEIEQRLDRLAKRTGRTKTFYAREAILEHLAELEDAFVALDRMRSPAKSWTLEQLERGDDQKR